MTPAPNAAPTETRLRLEVAATELHRAASRADLAGDSDPFSPWTALAGHIRLVAGGIAIVPEPLTHAWPPVTNRAASLGSTTAASPTQALRLGSRPAHDAAVTRAPGDATVVLRHLTFAAVALNGIQPSEAPTDVPLWVAHIDDLARNVTALDDPPHDERPADIRADEHGRPR